MYRLLSVLLFICVANGDKRGTCKNNLQFCDELESICYNPDVVEMCPKTCKTCTSKPSPPEPPPPSVNPKTPLQCGKPDVMNVRVIAGKTAKKGSWPWQILLQFDGQPMCGGTLIGPKWVVTAAHCVHENENSGMFSIVTGEQDIQTHEGTESYYDVKTVYKNENYVPSRLDNDIALLELYRPVTFNKYVKPICLPKKELPVGTTCYITGWGKIKHPGRMYRFLQQATLPIVSNKACEEKNSKVIPIPITSAMICGGDGGDSRRSGCHGDSGGPFVCKVNGVWELHGAVSHGSPECQSTQTYTVFARITHFLDWIKNTMKGK